MQYTSKGVGIDLLGKGQVEADLHLLHIQQDSWEMSFFLMVKTKDGFKRRQIFLTVAWRFKT